MKPVGMLWLEIGQKILWVKTFGLTLHTEEPWDFGLPRRIVKVRGGATIVLLVPSRTDTAWWHNNCIKHEVRFIRGRLKFGGSKNSAPFPSAVVVMKGQK